MLLSMWSLYIYLKWTSFKKRSVLYLTAVAKQGFGKSRLEELLQPDPRKINMGCTKNLNRIHVVLNIQMFSVSWYLPLVPRSFNCTFNCSDYLSVCPFCLAVCLLDSKTWLIGLLRWNRTSRWQWYKQLMPMGIQRATSRKHWRYSTCFF